MTDDNARCAKLETAEPFVGTEIDADGGGASIGGEKPSAPIGVFGVPEGMGGEGSVAASGDLQGASA